MRAEAQDHVDTINAALALLRRFLDWDRAVRRLDELNAKVEDPTLWDNPKAAQDVMRERRRLDEAITATRSIEKDIGDTVELIELAEMEGDEALVDDAVQSLATLSCFGRRQEFVQVPVEVTGIDAPFDHHRMPGQAFQAAAGDGRPARRHGRVVAAACRGQGGRCPPPRPRVGQGPARGGDHTGRAVDRRGGDLP